MTRLLPFLFATLALTGCPTEEHDGDSGVVGFPDCEAIVDACHDVDNGTGRASECHDTAHDADSNDDCAPVRAECVSVCQAIDGGVHHEDEDAGEHEH